MDLEKVKEVSLSRKKRKRIGRGSGSGWGKTSGRGHKGYGQRAGWRAKYAFLGGSMPLFRRLPRVGFTNGKFKKEFAIVNVSELNVFDDGVTVTPKDLLDKRIIRKVLDGVKVLGNGEITKKLTVKANHFSKSAQEKIQNAGGTAEIFEC